jgi:hypothetical protein
VKPHVPRFPCACPVPGGILKEIEEVSPHAKIQCPRWRSPEGVRRHLGFPEQEQTLKCKKGRGRIG